MGARNEARGHKAVEKLKKEGLDVEFIHLDLADAESIASAPGEIRHKWGKLDVLVNNAAILHRDEGLGNSTVLKVSPAILRETFETNFFGLVDLTQRLVPLIRESSNGRIVNVSSILGSLQLGIERESGGAS